MKYTIIIALSFACGVFSYLSALNRLERIYDWRGPAAFAVALALMTAAAVLFIP
jgi:hypothetical protein